MLINRGDISATRPAEQAALYQEVAGCSRVQRFTPLRADPRCVSGYVAHYEQRARALGL